MRRMLSKGVRLYWHSPKGTRVHRENYNFYQGLRELVGANADVNERRARVSAVGSESGAMVVHYQWAS